MLLVKNCWANELEISVRSVSDLSIGMLVN